MESRKIRGFSMLQIYQKISRSLEKPGNTKIEKKKTMSLLRNCWRQLVPTSVIAENIGSWHLTYTAPFQMSRIKGHGCSSVVQCLFIYHKVLGSVPSIVWGKGQERRNENLPRQKMRLYPHVTIQMTRVSSYLKKKWTFSNCPLNVNAKINLINK